MGRFFHMQDLVYCQRARLTETFAAFAAFERFLFAMDVSATRTNEKQNITKESKKQQKQKRYKTKRIKWKINLKEKKMGGTVI